MRITGAEAPPLRPPSPIVALMNFSKTVAKKACAIQPLQFKTQVKYELKGRERTRVTTRSNMQFAKLPRPVSSIGTFRLETWSWSTWTS